MRITTVFRKLLDVTGVIVKAVAFTGDGVQLTVAPTHRAPRCGKCGRKAARYDRGRARRWRHLGIGRSQVFLTGQVGRVNCRSCGVRAERVSWAAHKSRFTYAFEEMTAYLAQVTDKTTVTSLMGIAWQTVGSIVQRVVDRRLDPSRLDGLRNIGVDEFSYRKRHRYLTIVVDHDRRKVVWAAPGRSGDTLRTFFAELGPGRCAAIRCVTMDMAGGYITAAKECLPNATIVFDRFHVQRLASDALDAIRREQLRELRGTDEGRQLFRSRFALLKNPWNLNRHEARRLADLQETNRPLYRAYLLKEALARALEYESPLRAEAALREWLAWASRSKLRPFVKAARTVRRHFEGVLAYVAHRLTNGLAEGINTRLRMVARRAFGFHGPKPLIDMLFLCCGGIRLDPPLPRPTKR